MDKAVTTQEKLMEFFYNIYNKFSSMDKAVTMQEKLGERRRVGGQDED